MSVKVNTLRLMKWAAKNELNEDDFYYRLFLERTRKRKLKRDFLFDEYIKLANELHFQKQTALAQLRIIVLNKPVLNKMLKTTGMSLMKIKLFLHRKHVAPFKSPQTYKNLIYIFDVLNSYINLCSSNYTNSLYFKKEAAIRLRLSERSIQKLSYDYPDIYLWIKGNCIDVDCFVDRYEELLQDFLNDLDYLKDNINKLRTRRDKRLFLMYYRERVKNKLGLEIKYSGFKRTVQLIDTVAIHLGRNSIKINIMAKTLKDVLEIIERGDNAL
jgi:hypothetical protein